MSTNVSRQREATHLQALIFSEIAIRENIIDAEVIERGWTVFEEMVQHDISRSLASILLDRKLIDKDLERRVCAAVERLTVTCERCRGAAPLRGITSEGRIRCSSCDGVLELSLRDDDEAVELPLEERIKASLVGVDSDESPTRPRSSVAGAVDETLRPQKSSTRSRHSIRGSITRFEVRQILHSGPFGRLYLASTTGVKKAPPVAVKVLSPDILADPESTARLKKALDEWNANWRDKGRAQHVLHEENEHVYVARNFLKKPHVSLADLRLRDDMKRPLIRRVATLVADLHREGLVHGNIKPSNIIVRTDDNFETAYLIDPCLSRLLPPKNELGRWNLLVKAPRYCAPEVIAGKAVTAASDIYALGWVFFAILAGSPPFVGLPAPEVLRRHREGPVPQLPEDVEDWKGVIAHMTAVKPEQRPRNGGKVEDIVETFVAGKKYRPPEVAPRQTPRQIEEHLVGRTKGFQLRYLIGPVALLIVLAWVGLCGLNWYRTESALGSETRYAEFERRIIELEYQKTDAVAKSNPENGREAWRRFIEKFPASSLRKDAEAQMQRYRKNERIDVLELYSELKGDD